MQTNVIPNVNMNIATPTVDENALIQQAQNMDQQSLQALLDRLADAYYNATELVSDATYDKLFDIYESKFGEYTKIGAVPRGEKEELDTYRSGLRKITKEKDLINYARNFPGEYVLMDKIDGLNMQYTLTISQQGIRNEKLLTRGDGLRGKNVSHILPYLNYPKLNSSIDVIGEVYIPKEVFNSVGKAYGYKNARNMASSIVISKDSFNPVLAKELRFRPFQIVGSTENPEQQLLRLNSLGFLIPGAMKSPTLSMDLLEQVYLQRKALAEYDMDGEAIYPNRYIEYPVGEKPKHVVAFKMDEESIETVVTEVVWEASKNRLLKPAIHYQPVIWKGGEATLKSTNGDNARYIVEKGMGPGARIMVTRSGDVIPRITAVLEPVQPSLPDPNVYGNYVWNDNQVELVLLQDNDQVRAAKLESFFIKLKIEHLKSGRTTALTNAGLNSIQAVLLATPQQLTNILGPTLGPNAYQEIHTKIKNVFLPTLMAASGVFPNIGETLFKDLYKAYPQMYLWWKCDPNMIAVEFQKIKGFKKRAYDVANLMSEFGDWLAAHPMITIEQQIQAPIVQSCPTSSGTLLTVNTNVAQIPQNLAGKIIVFTLVRDVPLQQEIEHRGGKITSKTSRNTNYVITDNVNGNSASIRTARELGIPIMTSEQFRAQFIT